MMKVSKITLFFIVRNWIFCGSFLSVLLFATLTGCLPLADTGKKFTSPLAEIGQTGDNTARLSCFLNITNAQGPAIRLDLADIEVFGDDRRISLNKGPLKIDSTAIGTGQLFLGSVPALPGRYSRMRLTVTTGEIQAANGKYETIISKPLLVDVKLASDLNLEPEDSRSLLLTWHVQDSLQADNTLNPVLTAALPLRQMLLDLVFVSCPDIDTIFVVRTDKNWVVDSFGLKGGPTYMAIAPHAGNRLYVLAARDKTVKVIDLSTFRVVDFFPVPLNDVPTFMTISPDGQSAFLIDERSGYMSRMDLTSGRNASRVFLGYRPKFALYLDEQHQLAVSLSLSQKVLLLDPLSLMVMATVSTGSSPEGLISLNNQLFIAEYGDNSVSVADLTKRGNLSRLTVGFGPRRLLETGNQIYVSNYQDGSLSVLTPGQLGVTQEIFGLGRPLEMSYDQFYRRLYVADQETASLAAIDVTTNLIMGHIALGAKPFGLALIQ